MTDTKPKGLELLRQPFPANQISKLPKPTKTQTDAVRADFKKGIRCKVCGAWHHPDVVHLDYVGHAALTDRLLDADPEWNWEPITETGLPVLDQNSGMWIKLTVCGVTRLGYGHAEGKRGGDAVKEVIGDALRNAAMRFGAALDLWHKGDLHALEGPDNQEQAAASPKPDKPAPRDPVKIADFICEQIGKLVTLEQANAYPGKGKTADAWEWLAIEAPEQAARCDAALATKKDELAEAPF
jgi:hypothetical protein